MKETRKARRRGHFLTRALAVAGFWSGVAVSEVLPPPPVSTASTNQLSTGIRLFVRGFRFEGNHAYSDAELAKVIERFTQRTLTSEDLEEARRAVTVFYVSRGYITSGAVIPDQAPENGIITIRVVEGVLSEIKVQGNRWLRESYVQSHLERWSKPPLNLTELQEGLQLLRQNPNVRQVNAELKPGAVPGESLLDLKVQDEQPFRVGLQLDNQRPPSVGALEIWLRTADLNLTGHSDPLEFNYGIANSGVDGFEFSGANNLEGSYRLPFTRYDTTFIVHGSRLNTALVEEPFPSLDITSLTTEYGFGLRQPLHQTANQEIAVGIGFDHRVNTTWLLGEPFNISPGAVNGEMAVSVLRLSQEWLLLGQDHALALRSTFNVGLDVLGATDNGVAGDPNAQFVSWLGQAQYVQRLFKTQNQIVLRLAGQWTSDPLLALEQISIGGLESVRGYLENQLVRDRGLVASAEFRVPILFNKAGAGIVELAPFFDFGGGWNVENSPSPTTIYSTGVGLLLAPDKHFSAQIYWGYRLRHVEIPDDAGLQGAGVNFRVNINAF